jgi:hypothetical protein
MAVKVAVTVCPASSETAHEGATAQLPSLHPANVEPSAAVAVSVTTVPGA